MYLKFKRIFDIIFALILCFLGFPLFLFIYLVTFFTEGKPIHWSKRVGKNNLFFQMPKFRTMKLNTKSVATHLLKSPEDYLTKHGGILRKSSLDELPQLYSILKGDMSFVGPRPALYNQDDLIKLRKFYGVESLTPGLTGLAQINGRDELSIEKKVEYDVEYLKKVSLTFDLKIIFFTIFNVFFSNGVSH